MAESKSDHTRARDYEDRRKAGEVAEAYLQDPKATEEEKDWAREFLDLYKEVKGKHG